MKPSRASRVTQLSALYGDLLERERKVQYPDSATDQEKVRLGLRLAGSGFYWELGEHIHDSGFMGEIYTSSDYSTPQIFDIWLESMSDDQLEKTKDWLDAYEKDLEAAEKISSKIVDSQKRS